jgi:hypothetical protein
MDYALFLRTLGNGYILGGRSNAFCYFFPLNLPMFKFLRGRSYAFCGFSPRLAIFIS